MREEGIIEREKRRGDREKERGEGLEGRGHIRCVDAHCMPSLFLGLTYRTSDVEDKRGGEGAGVGGGRGGLGIFVPPHRTPPISSWPPPSVSPASASLYPPSK
jgi:hypothetical protein